MSPGRDGDWLPLDHYAAVGDGRSVALVGADGSIDWWCVPNLDSTPFFDRLLAGEDGGRFSVAPAGPFTVERRYRPGSNVLEQVFSTATGRARVTYSLNSGPSGRLPWSELAHRVEGLEGTVEFGAEARPGRRLGQANPWREASPHGDVMHLDGIVAALRTSGDVERLIGADDRVTARLVAQAGSRSVLALLASSNEPLILPAPAAIDAAPATSPATPATSTARGDDPAAATPTTRLAVETRPSLAPSTPARSQLRRACTPPAACGSSGPPGGT